MDLDLKSRGMLVTLLNLAEKTNWHFSERGLTALFNKEGKASIHTALKNLEKFGYLQRTQARGIDGLLGKIDYFVATERMTEQAWFLALSQQKEQEDEMLKALSPDCENHKQVENQPLGEVITMDNQPYPTFRDTVKRDTVNPTQYD
jgi:hypothetical protein